EIVILKQKLTKAYSDLGETVRPLIEKEKKTPLAENDSVKAALKKISDIEKSMKEREKEINAAKKEAEEKTESESKGEVEVKPEESKQTEAPDKSKKTKSKK
ncbi:hypothetical protein ACFL4L_05945, partial [bacterium]